MISHRRLRPTSVSHTHLQPMHGPSTLGKYGKENSHNGNVHVIVRAIKVTLEKLSNLFKSHRMPYLCHTRLGFGVFLSYHNNIHWACSSSNTLSSVCGGPPRILADRPTLVLPTGPSAWPLSSSCHRHMCTRGATLRRLRLQPLHCRHGRLVAENRCCFWEEVLEYELYRYSCAVYI